MAKLPKPTQCAYFFQGFFHRWAQQWTRSEPFILNFRGSKSYDLIFPSQEVLNPLAKRLRLSPEHLRHWRIGKGLSQEKVARLAGCFRENICAMERGRRPIGGIVEERLLRVINSDPFAEDAYSGSTWRRLMPKDQKHADHNAFMSYISARREAVRG